MKKLKTVFTLIFTAFLAAGCGDLFTDKAEKKDDKKVEMVTIPKVDYDRVNNENNLLVTENERLRKHPPIQVTEGFTKEQCVAVATEITNQSCKGKTETVTKTITKFRDRVVVHNVPTPAPAQQQVAAAAVAVVTPQPTPTPAPAPRAAVRDTTWDIDGGVTFTNCNFWVTDVDVATNRRLHASTKVLAPQDDPKYCAAWIDHMRTVYLANLQKQNPQIDGMRMSGFEKRSP